MEEKQKETEIKEETQTWSSETQIIQTEQVTEEKWIYKNKEKTEENKYIEIFYQDNDWTYYVNQKNFIDTVILIIFILFFVFSFISLSINFFKLWRD